MNRYEAEFRFSFHGDSFTRLLIYVGRGRRKNALGIRTSCWGIHFSGIGKRGQILERPEL